jgi:hypothetical protein
MMAECPRDNENGLMWRSLKLINTSPDSLFSLFLYIYLYIYVCVCAFKSFICAMREKGVSNAASSGRHDCLCMP